MATAEPPRLPDVVDEAGETPLWVPVLGLCLLAVAALWIVAAQATAGEEAPTGVEAPAAAADADEAAPEAAGEPVAGDADEEQGAAEQEEQDQH